MPTDIQFSDMQARCYRELDNLPSQHPHYSSIPNYLNEAKDQILTLGLAYGRQVLDQIPRLRNNRWSTLTVNGQNYVTLPDDILYVESMAYTKLTSAYDPTTQTLYPSNEIAAGNAQNFGILPRTPTTGLGWPTMWRRAGHNLELWPTPVSTPISYLTTIVIMGTRLDNDLSAPSDTLLMSPRMQLFVIDLAVAIAMEKMGWEEAAAKRGAVEALLGRLIGPAAKERMKVQVRTRIAGTPR
jgi:hypothetical protein